VDGGVLFHAVGNCEHDELDFRQGLVGCMASMGAGDFGLVERINLIDQGFDGGATVLWLYRHRDERQRIQAKDLR